jgi:hypothetical protein
MQRPAPVILKTTGTPQVCFGLLTPGALMFEEAGTRTHLLLSQINPGPSLIQVFRIDGLIPLGEKWLPRPPPGLALRQDLQVFGV